VLHGTLYVLKIIVDAAAFYEGTLAQEDDAVQCGESLFARILPNNLAVLCMTLIGL
jgi:hypothetical protein